MLYIDNYIRFLIEPLSMIHILVVLIKERIEQLIGLTILSEKLVITIVNVGF